MPDDVLLFNTRPQVLFLNSCSDFLFCTLCFISLASRLVSSYIHDCLMIPWFIHCPRVAIVKKVAIETKCRKKSQMLLGYYTIMLVLSCFFVECRGEKVGANVFTFIRQRYSRCNLTVILSICLGFQGEIELEEKVCLWLTGSF
jgi:hypothetical protein